MFDDDWDAPKHLRNSVLYFTLAVIVYGISMSYAAALAWYWRFGISALIVSLVFMGALTVIKDVTRHVMLAYKAKRDADAITPESKKLDAMHGLNDNAYIWLDHQRSDLILELKGDDAVFMIATPEGLVPSDFAADYFSFDDLIALRPIREYNGNKRVWAQALVELCVNRGWAVSSAGNQSALWKAAGKSRATRAMRLDRIKELRN